MGGARRPASGSAIHKGLVGERALVGTAYMADARLRTQYDAEIAPRTEAALGRILDRLALPTPRRVLDLGAGTGAVGRTLRARFGAGLAEVVAVDRVAAPGVLAGDVRQGAAALPVRGPFDLIVAAHLLNELDAWAPVRRAAMVDDWCHTLLAPLGTCIVIEPALKETSRALLEVRDHLTRAGLHVVAPCLHADACPALAKERDFCHDSAPWPSGNDPAGGRRGRVDYSYLVLRRGPQPQVPSTRFRIVSDLLDEKGRTRVWACGPAGRLALVLQDRDRREGNRAFADIERGDVVEVTETKPAGDGLHLLPTGEVKRW